MLTLLIHQFLRIQYTTANIQANMNDFVFRSLLIKAIKGFRING